MTGILQKKTCAAVFAPFSRLLQIWNFGRIKHKIMKLHLPRILAAAVLAACVSAPAFAYQQECDLNETTSLISYVQGNANIRF